MKNKMKNKTYLEMNKAEQTEYIEGIAAWRDCVGNLPDGTTLHKNHNT